MFKKDDYIVILDIGDFITECAKNNYCIKQRFDSDYIAPINDLKNCQTNGNSSLLYNKRYNLKDWRYATKEEIEHYEKIGKPYDVTTLPKKNVICGVELIKDDYYVFITKFTYLVKFKEISNEKIIGYYNITKDDNSFKKSYINYTESHKHIRKATQDEIDWLDACVKADTFIPKEKVMKKNKVETWGYKVGDIITYGGNEYPIIGFGGGEILIGNYNGGHRSDTFTIYSENNEEIKLDGKCDKWFVKNSEISLVKKGYTYEVVNCTSQEEWDYVLSKFNPMNLSTDIFRGSLNHCIVIEGPNGPGTHCSLSYFEEQNSRILSFEDWCKEFNHEGLKEKSSNSNFIVGRWYVCSNWADTSIAKYQSTKCSEFEFSEAYINKVQYLLGSTWNIRKNIKLASQEEIDKYLPENHPDRSINQKPIEKELITLPDDWYVISDESVLFKETIIKYLNDKYYDELIVLDGKNSKGCYYGVFNNSCFCESNHKNISKECVSLSLDQFIRLSKPEKWIPKVGDWVVITRNGGGTAIEDIGLVCKIVSTNAKGIFKGYSIEIDRDKSGNNDRYLHPDYIRKAEPHEIPKTYQDSNSSNLPGVSFNTAKVTLNKSNFIKDDLLQVVYGDLEMSLDFSTNLVLPEEPSILNTKVSSMKPSKIELVEESKVVLF